MEAALYFDSYVIYVCWRVFILVELWRVHRLRLIPFHQLSHQCLLLLQMKVARWHFRCLPLPLLLFQLLQLKDWGWCRLVHGIPCQMAPGRLISVLWEYLHFVCCSSLDEPFLCVGSLHVDWVKFPIILYILLESLVGSYFICVIWNYIKLYFRDILKVIYKQGL